MIKTKKNEKEKHVVSQKNSYIIASSQNDPERPPYWSAVICNFKQIWWIQKFELQILRIKGGHIRAVICTFKQIWWIQKFELQILRITEGHIRIFAHHVDTEVILTTGNCPGNLKAEGNLAWRKKIKIYIYIDRQIDK